MESTEDKLKALLAKYGHEVEASRSSIPFKSISDIDEHIPAVAGVYWIESTMPADKMCSSISKLTKRTKKVRITPPEGSILIGQDDNSLYIVYSGTEENINKRLKQHLFNKDGPGTAKLSCIIDILPFSDYEWHVGFKEIPSYEIRYAVEAWWRLNYGWPKFCLR